MFNKYVWETYLKSGGDKVVDFFRKNLTEKYTEDYAIQIRRMVSGFCPDKSQLDMLEEELRFICTIDSDTPDDESKMETHDPELTESEYEDKKSDFIHKLMDAEYDDLNHVLVNDYHTNPTPQSVFQLFVSNLSEISTMYCMDYIDLFVPYYFQRTFNVFKLISFQFEINLPPIPVKKNYKDRFYYYGEICEALTEFRIKNNLSPFELFAFLYDFAPKYIGGLNSYIINDLPEPKAAYFIGGAKEDQNLANNPDMIAAWQCNEDTRAGDIIVMYLRSPISAVNSVWRACSVGFIDPFFYYYRCTYISRPATVTPITQSIMKDDPILQELPIVRKNMQGINGVELLPSEYNHLMDLAEADVFRFECEENPQADIKREKDVEDKLIKPLLQKLGYGDEDYIQQLYIEIGNHNHALIPDFVLLPHQTTGHCSAFAIIEAKKAIPSDKSLEEAKKQARSYAKLLNTQYCLIASQEGIWITAKKDDYAASIFTSVWRDLTDADTFFRLNKLIGKR